MDDSRFSEALRHGIVHLRTLQYLINFSFVVAEKNWIFLEPFSRNEPLKTAPLHRPSLLQVAFPDASQGKRKHHSLCLLEDIKRRSTWEEIRNLLLKNLKRLFYRRLREIPSLQSVEKSREYLITRNWSYDCNSSLGHLEHLQTCSRPSKKSVSDARKSNCSRLEVISSY